MILVPFISARVFVALGFRVVLRVPNTFCRRGQLRYGPFANSGGSGKKNSQRVNINNDNNNNNKKNNKNFIHTHTHTYIYI